MEQENWSVVRRALGYHRYDNPAELDMLNRICVLLSAPCFSDSGVNWLTGKRGLAHGSK
jgi:hypothetical protein